MSETPSTSSPLDPLGADLLGSRPRVTNAILGLCLGVALADWISGGGFTDLCLLVPGFLRLGNYERLFLAPFLHGSAYHLVANLVFLVVAAPAAERLLGRGRVLLAFLIGGVAGGAASAALLPDQAVATASAGVFGIVGLLIGLPLFRKGTIPERVEVRMAAILAVGVVVELLIGSLDPLVNNTAHVAALVAGFLLAGVFQTVPAGARSPSVEVAAGVLLVGALGHFLALASLPQRGTLVDEMVRAEDQEIRHDIDGAIATLEHAFSTVSSGSANRVRVVLPVAQNQLAWYYVEAGRDVERGIALSEESNHLLTDQPELLDTLGYLYAMAGRCREAADAMGRAAEIEPAYAKRRDAVSEACKAGKKPDPDVVREEPPPPVSPARKRSGIRA